MKKIKVIFIIVVAFLYSIPIIKFNSEVPSISEIDNRRLTELVGMNSKNVFEIIDEYIKDRVGYRTEAINAFTVLNDRVFGEMVHPSYTYGKNGEVYVKIVQEKVDEKFINGFCEYLKKIQVYCEERGVPFLYCLNPGKTSIYSENLPEGVNYQNKFINYMVKTLEKYGINYISNYESLKSISQKNRVYNKKYDVGHWNDLGAFYGINNILSKVNEYFPNVRENTKSDFEITEKLETSLPVSHFEIRETVPFYINKDGNNVNDRTEEFSNIKINQQHNTFNYLINENGAELPNVLFFRGSYLNDKLKFIESRFGEIYSVHNYENLLNFDYYFNIFQPDCVILETAEYATNKKHFNYKKMINKTFNRVLDEKEIQNAALITEYDWSMETEKSLTNIFIKVDTNYSEGYMIYEDKVFDMQIDKGNNVIQCTINSKYYDENKLKIVLR